MIVIISTISFMTLMIMIHLLTPKPVMKVVLKKHDLLYEDKTYISQPIFFSSKKHPVLKKIMKEEVFFPELNIEKIELKPLHLEQKMYGYYLNLYFKPAKKDINSQKLEMIIENKVYHLGQLSICYKKDLKPFSILSLSGTKNELTHLKTITFETKIPFEEVYVGNKKVTYKKELDQITLYIATDSFLYDETYILLFDGKDWYYIMQYKYFYHYQLLEGLLNVY